MSRRRGRRRWPRWAEVAVSAAFALGSLTAGVWMASDIHVLASRGVVVPADVVAEHGGRDSWVEVEFTTLTGDRVRGETSNVKDLHGSRTLDIVYDSQDPSRLQAADWGFDYWLPGICIAGGALFTWLTVHTWRHGTPDWLRRD